MQDMAGIVGLILAGGRARRMGAEKPLVPFRGRPLIAHAVERARPQVDTLLINTNNPASYEKFGCVIVADRVGGFQGPLAGVLAGLDWMHAHRQNAAWLATFACDAPFFPEDMVRRLVAEATANNAAIAVAAYGVQHHPVFAAWRAALRVNSENALREGASRKMDDFIAQYPNVRVTFPMGVVDPFFNINTPEDLARAEAMFPPP